MAKPKTKRRRPQKPRPHPIHAEILRQSDLMSRYGRPWHPAAFPELWNLIAAVRQANIVTFSQGRRRRVRRLHIAGVVYSVKYFGPWERFTIHLGERQICSSGFSLL